MVARIVIVAAAILYLVPGMWLVLTHTVEGGIFTYFVVPLLLPFDGTYPFTITNKMNQLMGYTWNITAFTITAGLGTYGLITRDKRLAGIFAAILVLTWSLTWYRIYFLGLR